MNIELTDRPYSFEEIQRVCDIYQRHLCEGETPEGFDRIMWFLAVLLEANFVHLSAAANNGDEAIDFSASMNVPLINASERSRARTEDFYHFLMRRPAAVPEVFRQEQEICRFLRALTGIEVFLSEEGDPGVAHGYTYDIEGGRLADFLRYCDAGDGDYWLAKNLWGWFPLKGPQGLDAHPLEDFRPFAELLVCLRDLDTAPPSLTMSEILWGPYLDLSWETLGRIETALRNDGGAEQMDIAGTVNEYMETLGGSWSASERVKEYRRLNGDERHAGNQLKLRRIFPTGEGANRLINMISVFCATGLLSFRGPLCSRIALGDTASKEPRVQSMMREGLA